MHLISRRIFVPSKSVTFKSDMSPPRAIRKMSRWLGALPEPFTSCRPLSQPFAHSKGEKGPESGAEGVKVLESKYNILLMELHVGHSRSCSISA
ncbi:hypothetical protein OBBRIDRAFT_295537 [Obba rivulosa]|uniref:Uncharacterized protein n=1 Tax=Obba rivulosa TaxID=1052685 RepID=A0A8E2APA4_9APHY|nr:hypothetical protein OBBRIDRAFT_295537 [Obba rivulosa]